MAAPRPLPPTPPGLLDDEDPGKWERVKQALWETNINAPVRAVYNLMNTPYDVLMGDSGDAGQQAVADSFDAAGGITVGGAMIPKPSNAMAMGIKAYHGSPHSFDKFEWSPKTRGTGEGAQAYGDGLYFAEQEDIARSYRDALSPKKVAIGGEMVDSPTFFKAARRSPSVDDNIAMLTKQRENILKEQSQYTSDPELGDFVGELYDTQLKDVDREIAELSQYKGGWFGTRPGGSMYEVEINADPNAFLDWDKPLSEQPPAVADALRKIGFEDAKWPYTGLMGPNSMLTKNSPGQEIYNAVGKERGSNSVGRPRDINKAGASEALKEAGIPGIRFLDAGSRVTPRSTFNAENAYWDAYAAHDKNPTSETKATLDTARANWDAAKSPPSQTRNYVVFDDSLIDIIKKYGIAGLLGSGGMYGMSADEAQAGAR